ncbi:hypothetical protein BASA81_006869 [Batrachochytrium salamandrivorans]|nr:hypothetical protein BASA81_006869 [Batrachochytrium salamandrivorans]
MRNLSVLDAHFHDNGLGELVRDQTPRGGWVARAKDMRLVRAYILKATCKRRFLGWRTSFLELSEREISDFVGPQAVRLVHDKEEELGDESLLSGAIDLPLQKNTMQALDAIVGNDDGALMRQGKDFSYSCSEVALCRATLLLASLPVASTGAMTLCVVLLEEKELKALRLAEEKWKKEQLEAAAALAALAAVPKQAPTVTFEDAPIIAVAAAHPLKKPSLFACCFPAKPTAARPGPAATKALVTKQSFAKPIETAKSSLGLDPAGNSSVRTRRVLVIGTPPPLPPMHREMVDRVIAQIGSAASSDTYDASWKRVGSLDGLTWLMKDAGKVFMVRGTIKAPARSVFECLWSQEESLIEIEPRILAISAVRAEETNQLRFYSRTFGKEWQVATGQTTGNNAEQILKHYYVHADGTVFIAEISPTSSGGVVISPATQDTCHVAWVELNDQSAASSRNLAPWAHSRLGSIQTKMLGDRLHNLRQFGLASANFELATRLGSVVNQNGTSDGEDGFHFHTADLTQQMREREIHIMANRQKGDLTVVVAQVNKALEFVSRLGLLKNGAQYPFDCLMMWLLTTLPTQESWVEALAEQLSMKNVEAQSAYGRQGAHGAEPGSRISQILKTPNDATRDQRLPSL